MKSVSIYDYWSYSVKRPQYSVPPLLLGICTKAVILADHRSEAKRCQLQIDTSGCEDHSISGGAWVEAVGQVGFMLFGGEEAELIYNLSTMAIDLTIDAVNAHNKNKQ